MSVTSIQFAPLLPWLAIIFLATLSLVAFVPGIWFQARGTGWRMLEKIRRWQMRIAPPGSRRNNLLRAFVRMPRAESR